MTTEQEIQNYYRQYQNGLRAMSKEELEKMALEQAKGMRQMMQGDDFYYYMRGLAQLSSSWPQAHADEQEKPAPLTKWQRFRRWLREVTR